MRIGSLILGLTTICFFPMETRDAAADFDSDCGRIVIQIIKIDRGRVWGYDDGVDIYNRTPNKGVGSWAPKRVTDDRGVAILEVDCGMQPVMFWDAYNDFWDFRRVKVKRGKTTKVKIIMYMDRGGEYVWQISKPR